MDIHFMRKREQLKVLENGRGIKYILDEGYKILGNPIVMFDTSYTFLSCVEGVVTDDQLWNEITTLGTFSHETVDFFNTEGFIEAYAQSDIVSLMKSDQLKYDRANGILYDKDGMQLGDICIVACMKPFEEGDMELIKALCEILSVELQNSEFYQKIDRVYQETLLNDLIDGKIKDNETAKAQITNLYGELKDNFNLAVVDITQYEHTVTHLAYFRDLFKKIQPEYRYYIHVNNIVIIIDTDYKMMRIDRDFNKLAEFFEKYNIYAGLSSSFQDLFDLQKYYREAINALNYGLACKRSRHVFRYDNIRVEHYLNSVKNIEDVNGIFHPMIPLIQKYDNENHTSLIEVLYLYLSYGKDIGLTCEKAGITQDELIFQLKKLEETFEIEWKNGDMLFNLFISIKMLDCLS